MKKVLIVSGHTSINNFSFANKRILEIVKEQLPSVEIDSLIELYPDFNIDVKKEQEKLVNADVIVFQYPLFWYAKPSILQRWEEEVLTHGFAYGSTGTALKDKLLITSVTTGAPAEFYEKEGFVGYTLNNILHPSLQGTTRLTGMIEGEKIYTSGLSYLLSSTEEGLKELEGKTISHANRLVEAIKKACQ